MPILNIDGRKVNVDDSFLSMSQDQQHATVDEIAASFKPRTQPALTDAITDIPSEIAGAAGQGMDNIKGLANRGGQGPIEGLLTTGKALLGPLQIALSPATGLARSVGGHLLEQATHGVGTLIAPDIAAKEDRQKNYETAKGDVDLALSALGTRGGPAAAAKALPPPSEGQGVVGAANRLSGVIGEDVGVPRAIASDSMAVQRMGQGLRNIPIVGDQIPRATFKLNEDLGGAVTKLADQFGSGSGPNVANRIGNTIGGAGDAEAAAAANAAHQSDAATLAGWENAQREAHQTLDAANTNAQRAAQQSLGDMSPQDMGASLINRLRQGEQEARATKDRLYDVAGKTEGSVHADAVTGLPDHVLKSLDREGVLIDPTLTPASRLMFGELENTAKAQAIRPRPVDTPVAASAARPAVEAAATGKEPQSLLEFLASRGLGPDAELNAIGADSHTVNVGGVGRRKLVKQGGLSLDYAREAAEEAGYLRGGHNQTSTTNDLLDAIDAELRGQKLYPEGMEGTLSKRERSAMGERQQYEYDQQQRGIKDDLASAGYGNLKSEVRAPAIEAMSRGAGAHDAVNDVLGGLSQKDRAIYSADISGAPVDMQAIENTRKRLNFLSQAATNDADRRAARHIIKGFDDWLNSAFDNALFSGSDEAISAFKNAREANTQWRSRFFGDRNDAEKLINKIVTGEVTPQETANWLVGAGKVGSKGVSSRMLTEIGEALNHDPEAMQAIRGGVWNRITQATEGVQAKSGAKVADDIYEFFNGSGRDVAQKLYTPEQRRVAINYADTLRHTAAGREHIAEVAANTKPGASEVGIGPMQELANTVLGRGGKTDEALFKAIDSYAKSGGRGDIKTLAKILHNIPQADRRDLAGSIIRNLGISPRTGQFSPDVFASQWKLYTPQAKTLLFGKGPQRQAIDDIMTISERLKQVGQRFGNPSGTAQHVNLLALFTSLFAAPVTTTVAATGGYMAARVLASPAGAASTAKWAKSYELLQRMPSVRALAGYQTASRNLANTAQSLGSQVTVNDFMRLITGPVPSRAGNEQQ